MFEIKMAQTVFSSSGTALWTLHAHAGCCKYLVFPSFYNFGLIIIIIIIIIVTIIIIIIITTTTTTTTTIEETP
jgi:uncharacterized membrane protein